MSGLLLCGKRTANPYVITESGVNIYSIEELCYYLYNNTYMVGIEFFSDELIRFIGEELELPSLAQKLKQKVDYNAGLEALVVEVMSSVGYYSTEEYKSIEATIRALGSKSKPERMKARADMLLDRKCYVSAASAYKDILGDTDEKYEAAFIANIWNNLGVVYSKQFMFEDAVNCYKMACDIDRQESYFDNLICAAIFSRSDKLLLDITNQYLVGSDMLDHYLKAIESNRKLLVREREFIDLKDRLKYDGSQELQAYNDGIRHILDRWKDEYRLINR